MTVFLIWSVTAVAMSESDMFLGMFLAMTDVRFPADEGGCGCSLLPSNAVVGQSARAISVSASELQCRAMPPAGNK